MVLILHDVSDIFLESAKMAKYSHFNNLCNTLFAVFAVVFFVSRLVLLPSYVIASTFCDFVRFVSYGPIAIVFQILLTSLEFLHVFWFHIIFVMVSVPKGWM
jgi:hypothetical protein